MLIDKRLSCAVILSGMCLMFGGCNDCDDCGPLEREPTLRSRFINSDSLLIVQDSLVTLTEGIDAIAADLQTINEQITFYNDSVQTINLAITNGNNELDNLLVTVENMIDSLQTTFDDFQELRLGEEQKVNLLESVESDLLKGKLKIDSLVSVLDATSFNFGPDSLEIFRLPLSVNVDSTSYRVFINGNFYELSLEYERSFNEDEKSRIEVIISNIRIRNHTFKEAEISCEICTSNETSVTLSF